MQANPTEAEQWALDLLADIIDIGGLGGPCLETDCVECGRVARFIQAAFAEREARANDRALAEIGSALDHELTDVELETALTAVGIGTYGPDATKFEAMFAVAMKCRATLAALKDRTHG